jgi:hypothetical protein
MKSSSSKPTSRAPTNSIEPAPSSETVVLKSTHSEPPSDSNIPESDPFVPIKPEPTSEPSEIVTTTNNTNLTTQMQMNNFNDHPHPHRNLNFNPRFPIYPPPTYNVQSFAPNNLSAHSVPVSLSSKHEGRNEGKTRRSAHEKKDKPR